MPNETKKPRVRSPEEIARRRRQAEAFLERRRRRREEENAPSNPYRAQQIMTASPAERVVKLYEGVRFFLRKAHDAIERGDIEARHRANRRAADILFHLRETLDIEKGGEIAANLDRIYDFCTRRLLDVDLHNDATVLGEVIDLLAPIEAAWRELASRGADPDASAPSSPATRHDPKGERVRVNF